MRESVIEFLFNRKKYKLERFALLLLFVQVFPLLVFVFDVSVKIIFIMLMMMGIVLGSIQIFWYNKKKGIKTRTLLNVIGILSCVVMLAGVSYSYIKEQRLEEAAYRLVEKKAGQDGFTFKSLESKKDGSYLIEYSIGDTAYMSWYDWQGGGWVHQVTRDFQVKQ